MITPPEAAAAYYGTTKASASVLQAGLLALWRRFLPAGNWERQAKSLVPAMTHLASAGQVHAATQANAYIDALMAEQSIAATSKINPASFAGQMATGAPLGAVFDSLVSDAGQSYSQQIALLGNPSTADRLRAATQALDSQRSRVERLSQTILADVFRAAEQARITSETAYQGYMRMVRAGACARCLILAGRVYRWNGDFLRHPNCDCYSIPVAETYEHTHGGLGMSLEDYFAQMSPAEQAATFTKAGAEAIRQGADINQVVNARQSMYTTAIHGHEVKATRVGTSRRGWFGGGYAASQMGDTATASALRRRGRANPIRLTPDAIFKAAGDDRQQAIHLLQKYGYITPF